MNPNMEMDMNDAQWFKDKVRKNKYYAQNLYAALCNNEFQKLDVLPILKEETWSCSWRHAGGIVSQICGEGDYLNWYCSGIQDFSKDHEDTNFYPGRHVSEGTVTDEIRKDLQKLSWIVLESTDQ
jgi:hypothetical protein